MPKTLRKCWRFRGNELQGRCQTGDESRPARGSPPSRLEIPVRRKRHGIMPLRTRGDRPKVIVEEFIDFDYEITLLTIRQKNAETVFCPC